MRNLFFYVDIEHKILVIRFKLIIIDFLILPLWRWADSLFENELSNSILWIKRFWFIGIDGNNCEIQFLIKIHI